MNFLGIFQLPLQQFVMISFKRSTYCMNYKRAMRVTRSRPGTYLPPKADKVPRQIVWATINTQTWPAIIIKHEEIRANAPKKNHLWVLWFGDYRVSQITLKKIHPFEKGWKSFYNRKTAQIGIKWRIGVIEAIREYGLPLTEAYTDDELLTWAIGGFPGSRKDGTLHLTCWSDFMVQRFENLKSKHIRVDPGNTEKPETSSDNKLFLKQISKGSKDINSICLACYSKDVVAEHPIFEGYVCEPCKVKLKTTIYVAGEDGISVYCTICACVGKVSVCEGGHCNKVFCFKCIVDLAGPNAKATIMSKKQWKCFLCEPDQEQSGLIKARDNWQNRIALMYSVEGEPVVAAPQIPKRKSKIRVLSLFDGIGTGMYVLSKLELDVEKYYSCELDEICNQVNTKNFPNMIHLGTIETITEKVLKSIGPIDLLIGGSPCNDLSIVNPARKGLYDLEGTGALFFDYYRCLMALRVTNGKPFFWLYENVASMPIKAKSAISRYFECEPRLLDAGLLSGQTRPRLFWGNLPTLRVEQLFQDCGVTLQNHLDPGRVATVEKLQCVTTRTNSLKQGPSKEFPVINKRTNSLEVVSIAELERCFGFPTDYTDIPGLSNTTRQKLLGKAWSVPVIELMLRFLKQHFLTVGEEDVDMEV